MNLKARMVDVELNLIPAKKETPRHAYSFDPLEYCWLWLSSPATRASIHQVLEEFIDVGFELWHGNAWMEQVRSTLGHFTYFENTLPARQVLQRVAQRAGVYQGETWILGVEDVA